MVAASAEFCTKNHTRFSIAWIERNCPACKRQRRTAQLRRTSSFKLERLCMNLNKTLVASGKPGVEIDGLLEKLLCESGIVGGASAIVPKSALIGRPGVKAFRW
jgi:hypothetical protein